MFNQPAQKQPSMPREEVKEALKQPSLKQQRTIRKDDQLASQPSMNKKLTNQKEKTPLSSPKFKEEEERPVQKLELIRQETRK